MNDLSSLHLLLTRLRDEGIWTPTDEGKAMNDSPKTLDELKAAIRRKADEEIKELDMAAEIFAKYGLPVPSAENMSEAAKVEKKTPVLSDQSDQPKKYPSGYIRHEKPWTDTILDILKGSNGGLTHSELKDEIAKTHLAQRLAETETGFYGAIAKLKTRKKIIPHKGRLYTPAKFAKFQQDVEAGLVKDVHVRSSSGRSSPAKEAIMEFLATRRAASSTQIIKMLIAKEDTRPLIENNKASVYNLLMRLRKRGELVKRHDRYSLPVQKNEASTGEPGDASVNGRDGPLPIESYEGGVRRTLDS